MQSSMARCRTTAERFRSAGPARRAASRSSFASNGASGTGRRSWLRELRYDTADRLLLLAFFGLLVAFTILGFMGITSKLYVFPFLIALAGG